MSITATEFEYIRKLVSDHAAIALENGKEYLVEARLSAVARQFGMTTVNELISRLRTAALDGLHRLVIEAMTTNETSFFRDAHPFEALKSQVIPERIKSGANERRLTLWCGACSTGQEPYSIAMLLREHFPQLMNWKVEIFASDLSQAVLMRAREARYSQLEVNRGLPITFLVKYFRQDGQHWVLRDEIRRMVNFHQINLADTWPALPAMDVIFLRNVLIYFGSETKSAILRKIRQLLKPCGYLFLGTAETASNLEETYRRTQIGKAICYRPHSGTLRPGFA